VTESEENPGHERLAAQRVVPDREHLARTAEDHLWCATSRKAHAMDRHAIHFATAGAREVPALRSRAGERLTARLGHAFCCGDRVPEGASTFLGRGAAR
jgi:hypothetical protein